MNFPRHTSLLLPTVLVGILLGCTKKSDRDQAQTAPPTENTMAAQESAGAPMVAVRVPDEAQVQELLSLEQAIIANPASDSLRRELGRRALDNSSRLIWTAGTGRVVDPTSAVAIGNAERAAWVDGSRWAAYLIEWQRTDYRTPFGSVQAQVPGSMVERKSTSDSLCVALVKTNMP